MERQPRNRIDDHASEDVPEDVAILYSWASLDGAKSRDFSANRREYRAQMRHRAAEQLRLMELRAQSEAEEAAAEAEAEAAAAHAEADAATVKLAASRTLQASGLTKSAGSLETLEAEEQVEHMRRSSLREAAQQARRAAAERLEAARRAEAAALADSIARREEREIAEAQASALRQAAQHAESEARGGQTKPLQLDQRYLGNHADVSWRERLAASDESLIRQSAQEMSVRAHPASGTSREFKPVVEERPLSIARNGHRPDGAGPVQLRREEKRGPELTNGVRGAQGRLIVTSTPYKEFQRVANGAEAGAPSEAETRPPEPRKASVPKAEALAPGDQPAPAWLYPKSQAAEPFVAEGVRQALSQMPGHASKEVTGQTREAITQAREPISHTRSGAVENALQYSREQAPAPWFALKESRLKSGYEELNNRPALKEKKANAPFVVVYSLSGGVGKTSLVATLGRVLSSFGEKVLLTDTTSQGLLPFYFGAHELRTGVVRTFSPPNGSTDAPIHLVSYDLAGLDRGPNRHDGDAHSEVFDDLVANSQRASRVLMDLSVNCEWMVGRMAWSKPTVLVPLAADMNSVISLQAVERSFSSMQDTDGNAIRPVYLLNQFDASSPLHVGVREVLKQQLGERLLPFTVRRAIGVSEALAEGMTIIDYDPESEVAKDYKAVANWLRSSSAAMSVGFRNLRWSER